MRSLDKVRVGLTLLVCMFPALLPWPVTYTVALWFLISLTDVLLNVSLIERKRFGALLLNLIPFLLIVSATIINPVKENTGFLVRSLVLFAFPVGMILSPRPFTSDEMQWIKRTFIASTLVMLFFFWIWLLINGSHFDYDHERSWFYIIRTEFNIITKVHPGYASMYIGLSLLFVLEAWIKQKKFLSIGFFIFSGLLVMLFFLMARLPMVISAVAILIYILKQPVDAISQKMKLGIGISAIVAGIFLMFFQSGRFSEFRTVQSDSLSGEKENTLLVRKGIFECSVDVFAENFWAGTGPGRVQPELDYCYTKYEASVFSRQHFNTHNQFLDYGISYGIGGLIFLLVVLFFPFYQYRNSELIFILFQMIVVVSMLGENILSRQAGLVFYGFFNSLFWLQSFGKKND